MSTQPSTGADGSNLVGGPAVEPLDPVMLAEVLEALAMRLDSLETLVGAVTERLVQAPAGGPWAWRHLEPSQARALLIELRDWVDWLTTRYDLRGEAETIPPCWFRHPVAVEELTGLMVAWKAAYSPKETAPSDELVSWHDRWLWPTLHRLNIQLHIWPKCTCGSHAPPRPAPPVTDDASFTRLLGEASSRPEPAPHLGPADPLDATTAAGYEC